jgi:Lrp/AsnC family leucine-responsive transcriptional regulator
MAANARKRRQVSFHNTSPVLDACNLAILAQLAAEPRIPMRELARRVNMSAPAVSERVLRLKDVGIIQGEWLDINLQALGLPVTAYVRVRPMPGALAQVVELAQRTPEVLECHRVTGDDCLVMRVAAADIRELEALLDGFLMYGNTTSSLVVSSPVPPRAPPLPRAER